MIGLALQAMVFVGAVAMLQYMAPSASPARVDVKVAMLLQLPGTMVAFVVLPLVGAEWWVYLPWTFNTALMFCVLLRVRREQRAEFVKRVMEALRGARQDEQRTKLMQLYKQATARNGGVPPRKRLRMSNVWETYEQWGKHPTIREARRNQ